MRWTPWLSLWRAETRRLLRHPATIASTVAMVLLWVRADLRHEQSFPVLTNVSWQLQDSMLLLVTGAFFAAALTAVRSHRHATAAQESTTTMPRWAQTTATLAAAVLAFAPLALALGGVRLLILGSRAGAAGTILWGEVLSTAAVCVLAACIAVVSVHLSQDLVGAAIGFVIFGVALVAGLATEGRVWRWLTPMVSENPFTTPPLPVDLAMRPSLWHALWLVALAALVSLIILVVQRLPWRVAVPWLAVGISLAALSVPPQWGVPAPIATAAYADALASPADRQTCVEHDPVTYCFFEGFSSRVSAWQGITEAQLAIVPSSIAAGPFYVRQRLELPSDGEGISPQLPQESWAVDDERAGTPDSVPVSTRWQDGRADDFDSQEVLAFSMSFAARVLTPDETAPVGGAYCGGRGVSLLILALGTSPAAQGALETLAAHTIGGDGSIQISVLNSSTSLSVGPLERAVLESALQMPATQLHARFTEAWSTLVNPSTTVQEAADLLGVDPPPGSSKRAASEQCS